MVEDLVIILPFAEITADQRSRVGGKAFRLAWLEQSGYRVPPGFVIPADAFQEEGLATQIWGEIRQVVQQIQSQHPGIKFAVRSSALSEDMDEASFAGEYDSLLNLSSIEEIHQAILKVYASRKNDRVMSYRHALAIKTEVGMAVIVQQMVPASLAGVLFTVDPLNGDSATMRGNYVRGLGDRLVSGEVNPQLFSFNAHNGTYRGPGDLAPYAGELFRIGNDLTARLEGPQDIEWAVGNDGLYLLQTRPITTLGQNNPISAEWNDSLNGEFLWSNANFGEAIPDVMTPLTWSVVQIYAQETFGNPLPGNNPLMGNIGGRFYINLSLFASFMQALGFSRERMNRESQEFFGNLPEDIEIPMIPFSRWAVARRFAPFALRAILRRRANLKEFADFTASLPDKIAGLATTIEAVNEAEELARQWQVEIEPLLRKTFQMLQASTSRYENAYRPLRRRLAAQVGEQEANLLLSGVSVEGDYLASLGLLVGVSLVARGDLSKEEFMTRYGHRGEHEFELSKPRLAEQPGWLEEQLDRLGQDEVGALLAGREVQKGQAWAQYEGEHPQEAARVARNLAAAAAAAREREAIRSETSRLMGLVRSFALRAGALTGLGQEVFFLDLHELIAGLGGTPFPRSRSQQRRREYERLAALPPYPALIVGNFDPFQWAADPNRRTDIFDGRSPDPASGSIATADPDLVTGLPGSAGVAVGRVRRLGSLDEGHLLNPGEILVTTTTNVGWTPLFPRAAAIVTDVGAPLSHAAIVARELGIPAVIGTGDATMRLQTGELVRVDGAQGTVRRLGEDNPRP